MDAVGRLGWIQVDCADPVGLATFWGAMLGQEFDEPLGEPVHYLGLLPTIPGAPIVSFQRVPEAKSGKNRLHLDVVVEDVDAAADRVVELDGGVEMEVYREYGYSWRLATDPEGNEFCLIF